jgi:hypothetical protein
MQKIFNNALEFFPNWNFNNMPFYLFVPSLKEEEKNKLTTKIIKHKGRITFTISKETIIVIENSNFFKIKENKELIKGFDKIYFYDNNNIIKMNIKDNMTKKNKSSIQKIIKIITLNALNEEIEMIDSKSIDYFIQKGLNKNYPEKNTLCLLQKNKYKNSKELISYNFNNSKILEDNDIPFYHPKVPENFSVFCSEYEYRQVLRHIKTEEYKNQLLEKKNKLEEEQILKTEPEPNKKEFLCQICKSRFDNYLEHIKSNLHAKNKSKYNDTFIGIKKTFKRISEFNNKKNKKEFINFENNILVSTKEDSLPINEENNKNMNKTNLEKILEKNEDEKIDDNTITVKDILKILDTIEIKGINRNKKNKKRKKDEINMFRKDNNYIYDFKKIIRKIGYYNDLLDELK